MTPTLYWIKGPWSGKLAISARPRGGDWLEDEVLGWRAAGVDAVLSLLTPEENIDLQLGSESALAQGHGLRFLSLPVEDRGVPSSWEEVTCVVEKVDEMLRSGRNVALHCRQGIGRSGMIAAAVLVKAGNKFDEALKLISDVRGVPVPETSEQREWIRKFSARESPTVGPLSRASVK